MLRYIEVHLSDPKLSITTVAKGCGISTRYLSFLLKLHGTVTNRDTIVLTRDDYIGFHTERWRRAFGRLLNITAPSFPSITIAAFAPGTAGGLSAAPACAGRATVASASSSVAARLTRAA